MTHPTKAHRPANNKNKVSAPAPVDLVSTNNNERRFGDSDQDRVRNGPSRCGRAQRTGRR